MTNPYLSAAEDIMGQNLGQGPNMPLPNRTQPQSRLLRENVRRAASSVAPAPKPHPPVNLPQKATFNPQSQLGDLGALSGFSKIRKMLFLTAVGAGFAASLMYSSKLENMLLAEHPEFKDLRSLLPKLKKAALPTVSIAAFPTALALFTDREWKRVAWMSWLGATAYLLKQVGGDVYRTIKDSNEAGEILKEKKLAGARKKRAKRRKR